MAFRPGRIQAAGFTLVELIVVVAIIAILAAIAYPTYTSTVKKGNRADAKEALVDASQILERCFSQYYAYNAAGCPALPTQSANKYYSIAASPATTATTYSIVATPIAGTLQAKDTQCTSFTITNTGLQTATPATNSTLCWTGHN